MIKIRVQILKIQWGKTTENINKIKSWFTEKINKFDKSVARLTKTKREKDQITKIKNEIWETPLLIQ